MKQESRILEMKSLSAKAFGLALLLLAICSQSALAQTNTFPSTGNVGIGVSAPVTSLDVRGPAETTFSNNPALLNLSTTNTQSADMGGGIRFGGVYTGTSQTGLAYIGGVKENSTAGNYAGRLVFGTRSNGSAGEDMTRMVIDSSGYVGIGTTNPAEKLEIAGNIKVSGTGNITAAGTITGGNIVARYQDVAEWVESSQALPAATVVVLDHTKSNQVVTSSQSYDTRVAGVISAQPGIALGEGGRNKVLVATTGRVKVKVDATRGPIQIGDLLVTSDQPGVAMKSEAVKLGRVKLHRPGTLIGKALEPLAKGTGEILVLLSLQ